MAYELRDYFETSDGSRPETKGLADELARDLPLPAFALLRSGDVFEHATPRVDATARAVATNWVTTLEVNGAAQGFVRSEMVTLLEGNRVLVERLARAKPLRVDVATPGQSLTKLGLPRVMSPHTAGVFWDAPDYSQARIVLREEHLASAKALTAHELGHAIFYLALTDGERRLIYDLLRPTFGSRASMDEAFAIYTEREVQSDFDRKDLDARGIYGAVRRQWHEDHVFTRFIRKLYFPAKRLAGPKLTGF